MWSWQRAQPTVKPRNAAPTVSTASAMTPIPVSPPVIVLSLVVPSPSWIAIPKKRLSVSVLPLILQQSGLNTS